MFAQLPALSYVSPTTVYSFGIPLSETDVSRLPSIKMRPMTHCSSLKASESPNQAFI